MTTRKFSCFFTILAVYVMAACHSEEGDSITTPIWLSFWKTTSQIEDSLVVYDDGSYTLFSIDDLSDTTSGHVVSGRLNSYQTRSLEDLATEERYEVYTADASNRYEEDDLNSCRVSKDEPVIYTLSWKEMKSPNSLLSGFGCWPNHPSSPETQEMIEHFNALIDVLREHSP